MPTGAVGTVLFFSTIVELPVILFSYKFMDRFSGRTLMLLAFAIMVAQFLLYATAPNAFVAVVTMLVLRAIGSTLFGMILLKIVRGVVQVRSVSTALGVISATDAMSAILMQNLGGILVENTSIRILYFAMAGLMMPNAVPARAEHGKGVFVKISPQLREISDVKLRGIFRSRTRLCNLKRRARGRGSTGSRIFL